MALKPTRIPCKCVIASASRPTDFGARTLKSQDMSSPSKIYWKQLFHSVLTLRGIFVLYTKSSNVTGSLPTLSHSLIDVALAAETLYLNKVIPWCFVDYTPFSGIRVSSFRCPELCVPSFLAFDQRRLPLYQTTPTPLRAWRGGVGCMKLLLGKLRRLRCKHGTPTTTTG